MTDDTALPENVSASFQRLAAAAAELNAASDELGKTICALDAAIKPLNLGLPTWVPVVEYEDPDGGGFESRYIGYGKINGKWGIALSIVSGNRFSDARTDQEWLFTDAPRDLRIEAADKLPQLLEGLIDTASAATKTIGEKTAQAQRVVAAVSKVAPQPADQRKK
jgi:hypothetical protein